MLLRIGYVDTRLPGSGGRFPGVLTLAQAAGGRRKMKQQPTDAPPVGSMVEDKTGNVGARFQVLDIFPTAGPGGMMLGWIGYRADLDCDGPKAQAFTLRDWRERWKMAGS